LPHDPYTRKLISKFPSLTHRILLQRRINAYTVWLQQKEKRIGTLHPMRNYIFNVHKFSESTPTFWKLCEKWKRPVECQTKQFDMAICEKALFKNYNFYESWKIAPSANTRNKHHTFFIFFTFALTFQRTKQICRSDTIESNFICDRQYYACHDYLVT